MNMNPKKNIHTHNLKYVDIYIYIIIYLTVAALSLGLGSVHNYRSAEKFWILNTTSEGCSGACLRRQNLEIKSRWFNPAIGCNGIVWSELCACHWKQSTMICLKFGSIATHCTCKACANVKSNWAPESATRSSRKTWGAPGPPMPLKCRPWR